MLGSISERNRLILSLFLGLLDYKPSQFILFGLLTVGSPLLGLWLVNRPAQPFLDFPPATWPVVPRSFSWLAFVLIGLIVLLTIVPIAVRIVASGVTLDRRKQAGLPMPWWGWLGSAVVVPSWLLAWTRFAWFEPLQTFTFTPLWIGYILVISALTYRRTSRCLLLDRSGCFLLLFPLSAVFWWSFEYLNLFAENWYYVDVNRLGPWEYFMFATLPFSTVLPAVLATADWLKSFPRISSGLDNFWRIDGMRTSQFAVFMLVSGVAGLAGLAIWPAILFPLLGIAPLLLLSGLQALAGKQTLFSPLAEGDWRRFWLVALAGLFCGFFWELWNIGSLTHWEYCVPYVSRFMLFEMPLLGYAGYLPFGINCAAFAEFGLPSSP